MIDLDITKVLSAWGTNVVFGVASARLENIELIMRSGMLFAQFGVAVATIVYVCFKIRNERRK